MSRFREERERLAIQQADLAEKIDVTRRTISRWENDDAPIPSDKLAQCALLGFNINYVVTGEREPQPDSYYSKKEVEDAMHEWLSDAKSLGAIEIDSRQTYEFLLSLYMRNLAKVSGAKNSARPAEERDKKIG
ncbi:helix-turn-helix domain-containing protein [Rheinheimera maricola]|uniref:Helix-turn-helix transcriptional regulator n=1 Tax=Rheinheimera maricola TaxID=2793282 RepID=A0ABS7XAQ7_9GAMM|nr:helix-turn-helix transcriptional regulator [Rheinheimera maricola]MBZ9612165.1 helix-turn-helix transcriptional regulator [Rheinheimera maricola]